MELTFNQFDNKYDLIESPNFLGKTVFFLVSHKISTLLMGSITKLSWTKEICSLRTL